jgi:predicted secreted protein
MKTTTLAALALAACFAMPAHAASIVAVNTALLYDVLANDYNITSGNVLNIKVIERRDDGTIVVKVTTTTGAKVIGMRSSESVIGENPCYATHGGFHRAVPVGGSFTCVYDPGMYVSEPIYSAPFDTVSDRVDDVCNVTTKSRTHTGNSLIFGYGIAVNTSQNNGAC